MPRRWGSLWVLLLFGITGCTSKEGAEKGIPPVDFDPMTVLFTPAEPGEPPGRVRIGWGSDSLGAESTDPREFPRGVLRISSEYFVTYTGRGWRSIDPSDPSMGVILAQFFSFDLRSHLSFRDLSVKESGSIVKVEGERVLEVAGGSYPLRFEVEIQGRKISKARVEATGVRESPFLFAPGPPPTFSLDVPPRALDSKVVDEKDSEARMGHVLLIRLIDDYARKRGGVLPDRVDRSTLQVELVASGSSWPKNPYSERDMTEGEGAGDFRWVRCDLTVGYFGGVGWDGILVENRWGSRPCP